jgi:hypothetical protein
MESSQMIHFLVKALHTLPQSEASYHTNTRFRQLYIADAHRLCKQMYTHPVCYMPSFRITGELLSIVTTIPWCVY